MKFFCDIKITNLAFIVSIRGTRKRGTTVPFIGSLYYLKFYYMTDTILLQGEQI